MSKIVGKDYDSVEVAIAIAHEQNATELDLSGMKLRALPSEIRHLSALQSLDISANSLTTLPPEIKYLSDLRWLNIWGNLLVTVSPEIKFLSELRSLDISANLLIALPAEIAELSQLQYLRVWNNSLTFLAPEIGLLAKLQVLNVSRNPMKRLPQEIWSLSEVKSLNIGHLSLTMLDPEISKLRALEELYVDNNLLTRLPHTLRSLPYLKLIALGGNPLPLPKEYLKTWGNLHDSKVHNASAVLDYYFVTRHQPSQPISEAKVLILGEASVGKSALVRRLVHNNWREGRLPTEGILIKPMSVSTNGYMLNLWDFGGQVIMHATHTMFLTTRALYLLVLDGTQDEMKNGMESWLKLIRVYAPNAPIIVVVNKLDLKNLDLDQKGLVKQYNVAAFVSVSAKTGENIDDLHSKIITQIPHIPNIHDLIPAAWQAVRHQLESNDAPYLTYVAFRTLCQEEHIPDTQIDSVAAYFDALGIALRYQDFAERTTHILNPNWVIEAIYPLINDEQLKAAGGVMSKGDIARRLDEKYSAWEQDLILDRMVEAEVAFVLDERTYVLPSLLPKERPVFTWDEQDALRFIYDYDVVPPSLFNRFMARRKHEIQRTGLGKTLWRYGVWLHRQRIPYALVTMSDEQRRIEIRVRPAGRDDARTLLDDIRNTLEAIHREFAGIVAKELIPLPHSHPVQYLEYQRLLKLEARGVESYPGDDEDYSVRELLDGIATPESRRYRAEPQHDKHRTITSKLLPTTLVAFFAKPFDHPELAQRWEYRYLRDVLPYDRFRVHAPPTATASDLQTTLRDEKPHLVYFSGHGTQEGLVAESAEGAEHIVKWELIAELLQRFSTGITGVIFNCCYAEHIRAYMPNPPFILITQQGDLPDKGVAIEYMKTLFESLKAGQSLTEAHESACWKLKTEGRGILPILTSQ